jgi:hypothetical protein
VRGGADGAGGMLQGLTTEQIEMFNVGLEDFSEEEGVTAGVGPRSTSWAAGAAIRSLLSAARARR